MKKFWLVWVLFLFLGGCSSSLPPGTPKTQGDDLGNGGDPSSKRFERARGLALRILRDIEALTEEDVLAFSSQQKKLVIEWYREHRESLRNDVDRTPQYLWRRVNPNGACGQTEDFPFAPIFLSYLRCETVLTDRDAALHLVGESVHHFKVKNDFLPAQVGVALGNAWARIGHPENAQWVKLPAGKIPRLHGNNPQAGWTGTELVVWDSERNHDIEFFNPKTGKWRAVATKNRVFEFNETLFNSGDQNLGFTLGGKPFALAQCGQWEKSPGYWFEEKERLWKPVSSVNAPSERFSAAIAISGTKIVVWGGMTCRGPSPLTDGAVYDLKENTWTPISQDEASPDFRVEAGSVLVGDKFFFWGGYGAPVTFHDGAVYDLKRRQWTRLPGPSFLNARRWVSLMQTGKTITVYGGADETDHPMASGARLDPETLQWSPMRESPEPLLSTRLPQVVSAGQYLLSFGGSLLFYHPVTDTWLMPQGLPNPVRDVASKVFSTGEEIIFWRVGDDSPVESFALQIGS